MKFHRSPLGVMAAALLFTLVASAGLITQSGPRVGASSSEDWQLRAGNYQDSGAPLAIIYPQPDGSTQAWAYHRRMPSGYDRTIPVVPAFGCPPYHFSLLGTPPTGASINDTDGDDDEGDLTIPAPSVSSWTVRVRVQDQCGGDEEATWSLEVIDRDNTTYFVHLSDVVGGSETGTSSNPKHNIGQIIGPNDASTTWQGRQVLVRGTHVIAGWSASYDNNGSRLLMNSSKPLVWVAIPSIGATLRGSSDNVNGASFHFEGGTDVFFAGFSWNNPHVNEAADGTQERNIHVHAASSILANGGFWGNTFDLTSTAPDPGSNSAAIFFAQSTYSGNIIIAKNRFLNAEYLGPFTVYDTHDMAVVRNELTSSAANSNGFFFKGGDSIEDLWVAFNYGTGNAGAFSKFECIDIDPPSPWERGPIYYMHNRYVTSGLGINLLPAANCVYTVVSKRNSWKIANHYFDNSNLLTGSSTGVWDWDSIEHSGTYTQGVRDDGAGATITRGPNNDHGTSGILDDTTGLQEGGADCTHGAEICSSWMFQAPSFIDSANDENFEVRLAA